MKLEEFTTETLLSLFKGIHQASLELENSGIPGAINPFWEEHKNWKSHVEKVQFDIAIKVGEKTKMGGKAGIEILSVGAKGEASQSHEDSSTSRVKFTVPVVFPAVVRFAKPRKEKETSTKEG